jgi:hypothetical protein
MRDLGLNRRFGRGTTIATFLLHRIRPAASLDRSASGMCGLSLVENDDTNFLFLRSRRPVIDALVPSGLALQEIEGGKG